MFKRYIGGSVAAYVLSASLGAGIARAEDDHSTESTSTATSTGNDNMAGSAINGDVHQIDNSTTINCNVEGACSSPSAPATAEPLTSPHAPVAPPPPRAGSFRRRAETPQVVVPALVTAGLTIGWGACSVLYLVRRSSFNDANNGDAPRDDVQQERASVDALGDWASGLGIAALLGVGATVISHTFFTEADAEHALATVRLVPWVSPDTGGIQLLGEL
jgi:hypothetical protein